MKLKTHRLFAKLCEELITEVSSSLSIVQQHPGGKKLIQKLHTTNDLGHNQKYTSVPKISWSEVKGYYRGSWIIIIGSTGTAAIRSSGGNTGSYDIFASNGEEVQSTSDTNAGNAMAFIKNIIGTPTQFYVGQKNDDVANIKNDRKNRNAGENNATTSATLIKKFKPLWIKAVTAAIVEVKGMSITMIKNDSFGKAKRKIEHASELEDVLQNLQQEHVPDVIRNSVQTAIKMAAYYHYPELTGEITRGYSGYQVQNTEGPQKLLADIAGGDKAKLGTILGFFKRNLISG